MSLKSTASSRRYSSELLYNPCRLPSLQLQSPNRLRWNLSWTRMYISNHRPGYSHTCFSTLSSLSSLKGRHLSELLLQERNIRPIRIQFHCHTRDLTLAH